MCIAAFAQKGTRVGYMDMNVILENISEYNKANDLLDKNIENWKKEIELKKVHSNSLYNIFYKINFKSITAI